MEQIFLIRHGETEANRHNVFRGRNEIKLNDHGRCQSTDLANYFKDISLQTVYTSPLARARNTAEIAFGNCDIVCEPRLNNLDLGEWVGVAKQEIAQSQPNLWQLWVTEPEKLSFPKGETLRDVYRRVTDFLDQMTGNNDGPIAVVSHRSVLKTMIAAAIGLKERYYWRFHLDNASISTLEFDPRRGFSLTSLNTTAHLSSFVVEKD